MSESDDYVVDWFKPLDLKGDFASATLDGYFATIDERLKDDMTFLRKPIRKWRSRSWWLRLAAFVLLALGVILPLPILRIDAPGPSGLELGYGAVLLGGLLLFFDQVFAVSSSWMRLTLAEMQMKQIRYRLELEWARRRPLLTPENEPHEGPALIDILKTASDTAHEVMETQKEAWNNELRQGIEALRSRLSDDRIAIEKLRAEQLQEQSRPKRGAINLTIEKPGALKGPLTVRIGEEAPVEFDTVPTKISLNNVPAGLQTLRLTASRTANENQFDYLSTEEIKGGEIKTVTVTVE